MCDVELLPPDGRPSAPLAQWTYHLDQLDLPEWYDADREAARLRAAVGASDLAPIYAEWQARRAAIYADLAARLAPIDAEWQARRREIAATRW